MNKVLWLLLVCPFLYIKSFSQTKTPSISLSLVSKLPDTYILSDTLPTIILKVHNFTLRNVFVLNVPGLNLEYKVSVRNNTGYKLLNSDSTCRELTDPMIPADGFKFIKLKIGGEINIPFAFPPLCTLYHSGDYKIKFLFTYKKANKNYTIETGWFKYSTLIKK